MRHRYLVSKIGEKLACTRCTQHLCFTFTMFSYRNTWPFTIYRLLHPLLNPTYHIVHRLDTPIRVWKNLISKCLGAISNEPPSFCIVSYCTSLNENSVIELRHTTYGSIIIVASHILSVKHENKGKLQIEVFEVLVMLPCLIKVANKKR